MTLADCKLIFKQSSNTQRYQAFFRWGSRELFSSYFNLKSSKPTLVWSTCAISITCDKSITFFHFASNIKYLKSIFLVIKANSINSFMFYTKISKKIAKKFFVSHSMNIWKKFSDFQRFFSPVGGGGVKQLMVVLNTYSYRYYPPLLAYKFLDRVLGAKFW
jgi:hypothetical protein